MIFAGTHIYTANLKLLSLQSALKQQVLSFALFINTHTHAQIYDAGIELVNIEPGQPERPKYFSFGLHPRHIVESGCGDQLSEVKLATGAKACLAVGECGLDKLCDVDLDLQQEVFIEQVKIANEEI